MVRYILKIYIYLVYRYILKIYLCMRTLWFSVHLHG